MKRKTPTLASREKLSLLFDIILGPPIDEFGGYNYLLAGRCLTILKYNKVEHKEKIKEYFLENYELALILATHLIFTGIKNYDEKFLLYPLLKALKDGWNRKEIIWILGELRAKEAIPHLIQALKDENENEWEWIWRTLLQILVKSPHLFSEIIFLYKEISEAISLILRIPIYRKDNQWYCFEQSTH